MDCNLLILTHNLPEFLSAARGLLGDFIYFILIFLYLELLGQSDSIILRVKVRF